MEQVQVIKIIQKVWVKDEPAGVWAWVYDGKALKLVPVYAETTMALTNMDLIEAWEDK